MRVLSAFRVCASKNTVPNRISEAQLLAGKSSFSDCASSMDALVIPSTRKWALFWFGHGCFGDLKHFNAS